MNITVEIIIRNFVTLVACLCYYVRFWLGPYNVIDECPLAPFAASLYVMLFDVFDSTFCYVLVLF